MPVSEARGNRASEVGESDEQIWRALDQQTKVKGETVIVSYSRSCSTPDLSNMPVGAPKREI